VKLFKKKTEEEIVAEFNAGLPALYGRFLIYFGVSYAVLLVIAYSIRYVVFKY